jgi:hypothetical protein
MKFHESYALIRTIDGRLRHIIVEPVLLNIWWGAEVGPQTAEGIVEEHLSTIDGMVRLQVQEGLASPESNQFTLTAADWEDDAPYDGRTCQLREIACSI